MTYQTVYCPYDMLEESFLLKEEETYFKVFYNLSHYFSNIIIDLDDQEIGTRMLKDPLLKSLIKREYAELFGLPHFFEYLKEDDLQKYPNDVIICKEDDAFCNKQFEEKGVFITNSNLLPHLFNQLHNHSFDKTLNLNDDSRCHEFYCWENLLKVNKLLPCNCAIITDNFLVDKYNDLKEDNLFSIVKNLIPNQINIPFHLTLIIDNGEAKRNKEFFSSTLIPELFSYIKETIGKEINIEVVTHLKNKQIHQRAIILSHYFIVSDKGFNIFENGKVKNESIFYSDWNFFRIEKMPDEIKGELKITRNRNYLNVIKKQIERSKEGRDYEGRQDFYVSNNKFPNRIFS